MQFYKNKANIRLVSAAEIILTNDCNLRCKYCYSAEYRSKQVVSCERINEIVELLFKNAFVKKTLGISPRVNISFLGGGEPTLAWRELQYCIECVKKESQKHDIPYDISITTNGCLLLNKLDYLINENIRVKVSIDGLEEINDATRIDAESNGTYNKITDSIDYLNNANSWFSLGIVVGSHNYMYLEEFVRYAINRWKNVKKIDFSYLQENNTTFENGLKPIDYIEFLKIKNHFIEILINSKIGIYNQYVSIYDFLLKNRYYRCPKITGDKIVLNCDDQIYRCTRLAEGKRVFEQREEYAHENCSNCRFHDYWMLYNDNCVYTNDKKINKIRYCEFIKNTYRKAMQKVSY